MDIDINVFLGEIINDNGQEYKVIEYIAKGAVGYMFRCRNENFDEDRAIKFIPETPERPLKTGWKNEITKTIKLRQQENVVKYYTHNFCTINNQKYLYIMWEYIPNDTLRMMIDNKEVSIRLLLDVINTLLHVFHACKQTDVIHADLHDGNILIGKVDPINVDETYRKIWVTDFSRVTVDDKIEHMDDYVGLISIINKSLNSINFHNLDGEDKRIFRVIKDEFIKCLWETDVMVDENARNPSGLLEKLQILLTRSQERNKNTTPEINDYLAAEHLGEDFDEWKLLFVPKFIAINELLGRNICVLTGLRGCGKTMLFKRLSAYFNLKMGGPADLSGSDQFYGFYLNARDIAETFPWLPEDQESNATPQLIHNFNLKWTLEILIWLREELFRHGEEYDLTFINDFFKKYFPDYFSIGTKNSIYYLIELIKREIEKSRLKSKFHPDLWCLIQYDYLEEFVSLLKEKTGFIENRPFFFFLDDYSLPMVKSTIQYILNPIVFRRSANILFKISTESVDSFLRVGLNRKPLEENDDYTLIDCAMLSLIKSEQECKEIIFSIIKQRIERHRLLRKQDLTLEKMLGKTKFNDEQRAKIIRKEITEEEKGNKKYLYQGSEVFCRMWTSDVREMINLFADMVSLEENLVSKNYLISEETQDTVYKESGGQFRTLLASTTNPSEKSLVKDSKRAYARHLIDILDAFHQIASYQLKNKNSKNLKKDTIKKARRIEIANSEKEPNNEMEDYYKGLIRYGIFIQDNRGKSVRGKIAPRLFLRGRLIPFFRLAFSKRDSITMSWDDFTKFLLTPAEFAKEYINRDKNEQSLINDKQPSLFEEH
jgi:serine/threonine protein kinase